MVVLLLACGNVWGQTTGASTRHGKLIKMGLFVPSATVRATNTDTGFTAM